ncbi:hypothetical protein RCL1_002087 [Eukaryota sp. TZLM3-RCL]
MLSKLFLHLAFLSLVACEMKHDIFLISGLSGSGKNPRIDALTAKGFTHISSGNMFRSLISETSDLFNTFSPGQLGFEDSGFNRELATSTLSSHEVANIEDLLIALETKYYLENGLYVPDRLTNQIVAKHLRHQNSPSVLDGFPRTKAQASWLTEWLAESNFHLRAVILVETDEQVILHRLAGRRVCPACNKVYHVEHNPPPLEGGRCECGEKVVIRKDDQPELIKRRFSEFYNKTVPMISYLVDMSIPLVSVNGDIKPYTREAVNRELIDELHNSGIFLENTVNV